MGGPADNRLSTEESDLKALFDEWVKDLKSRILTLAKDNHVPEEMTAALGIPEKAVRTLLLAMVREGSIRITGIEPTNK